MMTSAAHRARWQRYWDRHAPGYDRQMAFLDRRLFRDTREWVCSQTTGSVLEVAVGTGLNLERYPADVRVTGIEFSSAMLAIARRRAAEIGRPVTLRTGNAEALAFPDEAFDTVVCTFSLCSIPDHRRAVTEMARVLRPGGLLLLADHVVSTQWAVRALQAAMESVTVPWGGEHFRRRPLELVTAAGLDLEKHDRFAAGIVERLAARKPLS